VLIGTAAAITMLDLNSNIEPLESSLKCNVSVDVQNNRLVADGAVAGGCIWPLRVDRKLLHALFREPEENPRAARCRFGICHGLETLKFGGREDMFTVSLTVQHSRLL
jgi:hypothetical protein